MILIQNKKDEDRENDKRHKRIDLYMPELAFCYPGTDIYLERRVRRNATDILMAKNLKYEVRLKQYESYPGKNRLQQKEKLNDETYHSVIRKSLKRILKLTVGFQRQGILTDPSIDLITRKSSAIVHSTND